MKKLTYLLLSLFIISCSSSDDNGGGIPAEETFNYFPLNSGTYWTYDNESDQGITRDSLYVSGIEELNGVNYTVLSAELPVTGFMTSLLSESLVRATDTKLILNGELGAPPVDGFPEITIPLDDVVLYDTEASNGTLLSEVTGEIEQDVDGIPIIIVFTISAIQGEALENGYGDFSNVNVLTSNIIVNLSIAAAIEIVPGTVISIPVLQAQDVVVTTNYFADGIGLINSDTLIEYQLEDLSGLGIVLPIPSEDSSTATQDIDNYFIGN